MNGEVCEHYEKKTKAYRDLSHRIQELKHRVMALNDPRNHVGVANESITYFFNPDRARELKVGLACDIEEEIKLLKEEQEAL